MWADPELLTYAPRGAALELFETRETCEILLESPAGCGKTRAVLQLIDALCWEYPGTRVLLCRETRKEMTETVLPVLEQEVFWPGHPALSSSNAKRTQRQNYEYPNDSIIVVQGVEDFRTVMSAQFDVIVYIEATDGTEEGWDYLISRGLGRPRDTAAASVSKIPFKLAIAECNPDREDHWLNQRAESHDGKPAKMRRMRMFHSDNPVLDGEKGVAYLKTLSDLPEPRRSRLCEGKWISAEGLIYPNWNRSRHLVPASSVPEKPDCYVSSMDWGMSAPGAMQTWACFHAIPAIRKSDGMPVEVRRAYRVEHIYRTNMGLSWWADQVERVWRSYQPYDVCVADPARKDLIDHMNERLSPISGRSGDAAVVVKADNRIQSRSGEKGDMVGLDLVRWSLDDAEDGLPRALYVRDTLVGGEDPELVAKRRPTSLETGSGGEIASFRRISVKDGQRVREVPDPSCEDHELDCDRYFKNYWWGRDLRRGVGPLVIDRERVACENRLFARALERYGAGAFAGDKRFTGFDVHAVAGSHGVDPSEDDDE